MIREYELLEGATFPEEVAKRVSATLSGEVPELLAVTGRRMASDELSARRPSEPDRPFSLSQVSFFDEVVTAQDTFTQKQVKVVRRDGKFVIEEVD